MRNRTILYSLFSLFILIFGIQTANAQFIRNGKIAFERKTNIRLMMQNEMSEQPGVKDMLKMMPHTMSSYYNMYFTPEKSMYTFEKHEELKGFGQQMTSMTPGSENKVFTDLISKSYIAEKNIFGTIYSVNDTYPPLKWKLEDEIRVIAGYSCRKAVTTINDSVVVVAFYTDEILAQGGPESFNGLPGMILGVAIPRMYTTWFATKVDIVVPTEEQLKPATKGKKVTLNELVNQSTKSLESYGDFGKYAMWWIKL